MKWSNGNNTQQAANLKHSLPLKKEVQSFQIFFLEIKFSSLRELQHSQVDGHNIAQNKASGPIAPDPCKIHDDQLRSPPFPCGSCDPSNVMGDNEGQHDEQLITPRRVGMQATPMKSQDVNIQTAGKNGANLIVVRS